MRQTNTGQTGADMDLPTRLGWLTQAFLVAAAAPLVGLATLAIIRVSWITSVDQIVFFVAAPVVLAALLIVASRRPPAVRLSLVLGFCAVAGSLLVAEGILFAAGSLRTAPVARFTSVNPVRGLTIWEGVDSIRSRGEIAFPTIPGNVLVNRNVSIKSGAAEVHPVTPSPGLETTVLCNETGTLVTYRSDRFGFNNPDSVWDRSHVDVALVGDSYTHGLCVEPHEQTGARLAEKIPTVNLGARGFGPLLELAVMREYGHLLRPSSVVWIYYEGNDRYDLVGEVQRDWLVRYLREPSHRQRLAEIDIREAYGEWINEVIGEEFGPREQPGPGLVPGLRSLLTLSTLRQVIGFGVVFPAAGSRIGRLPEVMVAARETVSEWGGRITFVYLPAFERFRVLVGEGVPGRSEVLDAAAKAGFEVIDLTSHFEETGAPRELWASPRGHLAPDGYRLMADIIGEAVGLR